MYRSISEIYIHDERKAISRQIELAVNEMKFRKGKRISSG
jgi:hypothetical protein